MLYLFYKKLIFYLFKNKLFNINNIQIMSFIKQKYYYMDTQSDKIYATLWNGFLKYKKLDEHPIPFLDIDNILVDICNINFYVHLDNEYIYISLCQDEKYYAHQFEIHIKKVIRSFEEKFNLQILSGEFNATELRHQGDQIKYTISKLSNNNISLKKRILNWESYERRKKHGNIEKEKECNITEKEREYNIIKKINELNI